MVIKKETQNYITIEVDKKDAAFLCQCMDMGLKNIPMAIEDHTRINNFLLYLWELSNKT